MATPKTGNPVGRPPILKSPEEAQERIDKYFAQCEERDKPKTIAGLAVALGFSARQTLYVWEERPGFQDVIRKARAQVEAEVEERMIEKGHAGVIFWAKNHAGYKDRSETQVEITSLADLLKPTVGPPSERDEDE